jgi:molybdenum cofactor guanylyltransferase
MDESRIAAIIVAGGKSTRLGRDKASEPLLGIPLLQRVVNRLAGLVDEYVIVKARGQRLPELLPPASLVVVEDVYPEIGPLGGLYAGLRSLDSPYAVAFACDMPLLQRPLVEELIRLAPGHDIVVPVREGFPEPLCAAYSRTCLAPIQEQIDSGNYKIAGFYGRLRPLYLSPEVWRAFDPEGLSFLNLNREEDLRRAESLLSREEAAGAR